MNVHLRQFLLQFSLYMNGDGKITEDQEGSSFGERSLLNAVKLATTCIPVVNTVHAIFKLRSMTRADDHEKRVEKRAITAYNVICLTGLGILLLPVNLLTTAARKIYNLTHKEGIYFNS